MKDKERIIELQQDLERISNQYSKAVFEIVRLNKLLDKKK